MAMTSLHIEVARDAVEGARVVADLVRGVVDAHHSPAIGLATGGTMAPVYDDLVDRYDRGEVSFSRVRPVMLDEYLGLPTDDSHLYRNWLEKKFLSRVDLDVSGLMAFDVDRALVDADRVATAFEDSLRESGGVDLQLLGLGHNGHIAFNEPGTSSDSRTRAVTLSEQTRAANARFFDSPDLVPTHAITQGIATILDATTIVLAAFGASKASALAHLIDDDVDVVDAPVVALRRHPNLIVVCDPPALRP